MTSTGSINNEEVLEQDVKNDVSYRDGFHFYFNDFGHVIHAFGSALTGKEIVYVDDEIVVEKFGFRRKSCLKFKIEGRSFEIEFNQVNIFTGELHCSLIKEGVHVKTFKRALKKQNQLSIKYLSKFFLLGIIFGLGGVLGYVGVEYLMQYFN